MPPLLLIEAPELDASILNGRMMSEGFDWRYVPDQSAALKQLERESCSLLLTGLKTLLNGPVEIWDRLRRHFAGIPIVVVTDDPSEGVLREVLHADIAGYLPTQNLSSDLFRTVRSLLDSTDRPPLEVRRCYTFDNNPDLLPLIVNHVGRLIDDWKFTDPLEPDRITIALTEALDNALYHGNLGLDSELRQGDGVEWRLESQRRRGIFPYRDRRIRFHATITSAAATFAISDEGTGFDPSTQGDCTDPENLELCSGRGLMLMHKYMDHVSYNATGNAVTLVKHRPVSST